MTPAALEEFALSEIQTVRGLLEPIARAYWQQSRTEPAPSSFDELISPVLTDMETNRAKNQQEFLQVFLELINRSEQFLREQDLVDLPERRSLFTDLSPAHFAGAAVGGVYSAGPFDPEAETLFYLPPQFAENLWHRVLLTPIQLPSYFIGFRKFAEVFESEQARLGERFSVKDFNNAVLQSGGIPLDMLDEYISTAMDLR